MPCFCLQGGGVALQSGLCQALSASPAISCRFLGALSLPHIRLLPQLWSNTTVTKSVSSEPFVDSDCLRLTVNSLELRLIILFRALRWVRLTWTAGWVLESFTDIHSQGSSLVCTLEEIALMLVLNHSDQKKQKTVFVPLFLLGIVPPKHDYLHIVRWHMLVRGDDEHL